MRIACWIHNATHTSTHTICNTHCFPLQQWLLERASILPYTYIVCPVWYLARVLNVGWFLATVFGKYRAFHNVLQDYKILYRKTVGHVFTKPAQIEGTTQKLFPNTLFLL